MKDIKYMLKERIVTCEDIKSNPPEFRDSVTGEIIDFYSGKPPVFPVREQTLDEALAIIDEAV